MRAYAHIIACATDAATAHALQTQLPISLEEGAKRTYGHAQPGPAGASLHMSTAVEHSADIYICVYICAGQILNAFPHHCDMLQEYGSGNKFSPVLAVLHAKSANLQTPHSAPMDLA